jgi:hypothetical protein
MLKVALCPQNYFDVADRKNDQKNDQKNFNARPEFAAGSGDPDETFLKQIGKSCQTRKSKSLMSIAMAA